MVGVRLFRPGVWMFRAALQFLLAEMRCLKAGALLFVPLEGLLPAEYRAGARLSEGQGARLAGWAA
jgi:hypothetical protein